MVALSAVDIPVPDSDDDLEECDLAPRELEFFDCEDFIEEQGDDHEPLHSSAASAETARAKPSQSGSTTSEEVASSKLSQSEMCTFDVTRLPSPTRNSARRQQLLTTCLAEAVACTPTVARKVEEESDAWSNWRKIGCVVSPPPGLEEESSVWSNWRKGGCVVSSPPGLEEMVFTPARPKRNDFLSLTQSQTVSRMLQNSATPTRLVKGDMSSRARRLERTS